MECRIGCAACCVVISISSPLPGMPYGKPAGMRCMNLTEDNQCQLFGLAERPEVCLKFQADSTICGSTNEEAYDNIRLLENSTG